MDETSGRGRAALIEGETEFDTRDARLLRVIAGTGSVADASAQLGRSRARALSRIETLEEAFGELVRRRRGGSGGGGSQLTTNGERLLNRYDRLEAALAATARVPETVLQGTVTDISGELAEVNTTVGPVRGRHTGIDAVQPVQVRIGADAVTVHDADADPEPDATSARNRLRGRVSTVDTGETVFTVNIDVEDTRFPALVTQESATRLGLEPGQDVAITWKATATRLVPETRS